ncbi:2-oxoacid-dependent dioxygenase [Klebsormidium nitens]|uniref:2-oxoacid-dependent dioxygenase n=1 Tax=Klebsormidium nitens TaxID=105231 RepID=A0A1Y1IKU1_KLENI|nr:2-oxoacid-dependent dioxygenase [Klebsormidium nitens]|eukprot:GAQ89396.1 2-oxoacid-dependent dioxygenase [Klebsormidium nitens]
MPSFQAPSPSEVPVISLSGGQDQSRIAAAIKEACVKSGFFYVADHGVDEGLVQATFEQCRLFFSLPEAEKMKYLQDSNNRGYTPFEEETLDVTRQKKGDTKEGYYIGREVPLDHPDASTPLCGPNVWPDPDVLPLWRPTMERYMAAMTALALRLTRLIGLALGLPDGFFDRPGMFDKPSVFLRPLHYNAEPSAPEDGIFGAGAHSDYGMLTLLKTDDVPGLQICLEKDAKVQQWIDVPPVPGAFIVNLGDMLERWSNDRFRSTLHRVIGRGQERYSIPFFFEPNFDCLVECLPQCYSDDDPPKYAPIKAGHYLLDKYGMTHAGYKG